MTEKQTSTTTPSATLQSNIHSPKATDKPLIAESADDEPYTIKCICNYSGDDGNTIYCETCDTWQHIECFYPGRLDDASREEFDHSCADCKPRPLDRRHVTDQNRNQRLNKQAYENGEKKAKRPISKSHKKTKPVEFQETGSNERDGHRNGMPEAQPSVKKPKGYRSQTTMAQTKRSPLLISRPDSNAQPQSPAYTPSDLPTNFQFHGYSDNFLTLYNQGYVQQTFTNSFASLSVSNSMTDWLRDQTRLYQDAGVREKEDVFLNLKVSVDTLKWPELRIERKETPYQDITLHWQYLITPVHLPQPGRIVELNGLVGFQKDYCNDVENRWADSAHPRPFVFFHPRLPLCIDTRKEGSIGRYVRRSCRANTNLETFIANGTEYHFWLTSDRSISANEQITIPWDFRFPHQYRTRFLNLLNLGDEETDPLDGSNITDEEYEQLTQTIHLVLSDHGGCACNLGNECAFARFHRNYQRKIHLPAYGLKSKKSRKAKQPQTSPKIVEYTTSTRAVSEGSQVQGEENDRHSVSGSFKGKPHSRDLTPAHGNGDTSSTIPELSDREKRKLAMLEDSFRKMEQGQPPRKKKRASDGTNTNSNTSSHQSASHNVSKSRQRSVTSFLPFSAQAPNGSRSRHTNSSIPRRPSGSHSGAPSPSEVSPLPSSQIWQHSAVYRPIKEKIAPKPQYIDSSTQTDEVPNAWWKEFRPKKKKSVMPLAKRLLHNRYRKDMEGEQKDVLPRIRQPSSISPISQIDPETQPSEENLAPLDPRQESSKNVDALNADMSSLDFYTPNISSSVDPPPPWPGQPYLSNSSNTAQVERPTELKVQIPHVAELNGKSSNHIAQSPAAGSSTSSYGSTIYSSAFLPPVGDSSFQQPSPLKMTKKLSLSDYKAARMKKTEPTITPPKDFPGDEILFMKDAALKPFSSVSKTKSSDNIDEPGVVNSSAV
ncbi:hypothetical protein K3495_g8401 [Podosphaera aphanis]|nr:hypothetical protein K3495_g8401 [Podosphaera aphanis]